MAFDSDGDVKYAPTMIQPFTGALPWQPGWSAKPVKTHSTTVYWKGAGKTRVYVPPRVELATVQTSRVS